MQYFHHSAPKHKIAIINIELLFRSLFCTIVARLEGVFVPVHASLHDTSSVFGTPVRDAGGRMQLQDKEPPPRCHATAAPMKL